MTDCPMTGSVAFYATLLQPIERSLVLIWPSVYLVTNNPDAQQQQKGIWSSSYKDVKWYKMHIVGPYKAHVNNNRRNVKVIKL